MKITDGKKTVEIKMVIWEGAGYSPDWSMDFFDAGLLEYDSEKDVYIVKDVDYCIEQANDWRDSIGDYRDDTPNENNTVFIEELN